MSDWTNQDRLRETEYRDSSNLDARVVLHTRFSANPYGWQRWVLDRIQLSPRARLLELGCGPAYLWRENVERIPEGWDITLSDLTAGMVQQAQTNLQDVAHSFSFRQIDAQEIPFPDGSFDAVIANHMLYHVPDMDKALAEIRRVLRPGSRLYATTVGRAHLRELDELLCRASPGRRRAEEMQFTLENGAAVLERFFPHITLDRYPDSLVIPELEPLVDWGRAALLGDRLPDFVALVRRELEQGPLRVTKDSGLFTASCKR